MRRFYPLLLVLGLVAIVWWWARSRPTVDDIAVHPLARNPLTAGPGSPGSPVTSAAAVANAQPAGPATASASGAASLARLTYAQAWDADLPPALAAFREWTGRYLAVGSAAERQALESEGLMLARARRVAMKQLIERDPRAALESTVPMAVRAQLPVTVIAELETRFSVVGDFSLLAFDYGPKELIRRKQMGLTTQPFQSFVQWPGGPELRAYVYGRREGQTTKNGIPLHGVQLDGVVALHESAVRLLEPGEEPAPAQPLTDLVSAGPAGVSPTATLAEIGGRIFRFASPEEAVRADRQLATAEAGIGPDQIPPIDGVLGVATVTKSTGTTGSSDLPLPATAWTVGNKKMLVIRVDFSDLTGEPKRGSTIYTKDYVQNLTDTEVAPYYVQSSYNTASLTTTVTTQVYRMPQTASAYAVGNLNTQLHTDARTAAAANYTLASYDRIFVLFSSLGGLAGSQITYGGLANVGGANAWSNGEWDFRVVAHELGHTWGLRHANLWQVTDGNPVSTATTAASTEYGDDFDTMGANFANDRRTDFNPWFKNLLGWVNDSQVQTITSTGTYRVNRFDNATGSGTPLALKVVRDGTRSYWIGARRAFTTNASMQHGAYVIWGYGTNTQSNLLDLTTPGTGVSDAALAIGSTLLDTAGNVSIKLVSEGGTAPNEYLDVLVTVGLNGMPVISAHPQTQGFSVGGTVSLSVTATGTAPIVYQWRKNGADIAGANAATYTINNAQAFHAGSYTVQLSNAVATIVSNPATVAVFAPPVIDRPPGNVIATVGRAASFTVAASGIPTPTYQWRKGNIAIAGATNATFTIGTAQATDAGSFDVVVTNSQGSVTSSAVALSVNPAPGATPANDNFASALVLVGNLGTALGSNVGATGETGEPAHLTDSSGGHGTSSSVWFRWTPTVSGSAQIDTIGSVFDTVLAVYSGSVLTSLTKLAQDDDSGDIAGGGPSLVTLNVTAGTTYSIAVGSFDGDPLGNITLNYVAYAPPAIGTQPTNVTANLGGAASFSVVATGSGLSYKWYHDGVFLPGATTSTLALGDLQIADAGSYLVVVSNISGSVTSNTVTLSGAGAAASITVQPANLLVTSGQTATFGVTATATGTLGYQWRRNGNPITGANSSSYTLSNVTRPDADFYDVVVYSGLTPLSSQAVRLSVAPTAYPGLVAPDVAWNLRPETAGSGTGYALAPLSDGRFYVAGAFTGIDSTRRTAIALVKADGTPDSTFNPPEIDNLVRAVVVQSDGKVVVGGDFVRIDGVLRNRLARLNADGTIDPSFNPGTAANGAVNALLLQPDGKILVGGSFGSFAGSNRGNLVRLNTDGSIDTGFLTLGMNGGAVNALARQADGKIVVGGAFTSGYLDINGSSTGRQRLARLNGDGTLDTAFAPLVNGAVTALAIQIDGKMVVGGAITIVNSTAVGGIARLNADASGTLDTAFVTAAGTALGSSSPLSFALQADGKILMGGSFATFAGTAGTNLVRLNADGSRDTGYLCAGMSSTVVAVAVLPSGRAVVAGAFGSHVSSTAVSTTRLRFARLNTDGSIDTAPNLTPRTWGSINSVLLLPGGKTLITGYFTSLRGATVPTAVARINADGSVDATFNAGGSGANSNVYASTVQSDGKIFITGFFTTYNGASATRLARLNADGTLDTAFSGGAGLDSAGYTLTPLTRGRILVGGLFTLARGVARNRLAVFGADGSLDNSFDPGSGAGSSVYTTAVQVDGKILVGGNFTSFNGTTANRLVRLTSTGALDGTFVTGSGANSDVYAVAVQPDGKIVIGGFFTAYNTVSRSGVARLSGTDGSLDTSFVPPVVGSVLTLGLQEDGRVILRGMFASVDGAAATSFLGRLNANGTRDTSFGAGGIPLWNTIPSVLALRDNGQLLMTSSGAPAVTATVAATLPSITTSPASQTVAVGSSATLSVVSDSLLPLSYRWLYNGGPLVGATTASIFFTNLQTANAGNYSAIVTSELGSTTSATAVLTVGTAVAITLPPSASVVNAGGNATFTVSASGSPAPSYQWQRQPAGTTGFSNLGNDAIYSGVTTATLTVAATTVAMRGDQFQCVVSNGVGAPVTTAVATLTVNVAPLITSASGTTFFVGQPGSFVFVGTGTPTPTFSVTNGAVPEWVTFNATTGALSGTPTTTAGSPFVFTISASNGALPNAAQVFTLTVLPAPVAPTITTPPIGQVVAAGATITLSVGAGGTPVPSYQWRRNTVDIAGATNATYTRTDAKLADAGSYTVYISNSAGSVTSTAVTVSVIPAGTSAQHSIVRAGYTAGGTVRITNTLAYSGAATGATWHVLLPTGWSFASSAGDAGAARPSVGTTDLADWTWTTPPTGPITFTYTLNVPVGTNGSVSLVASATVLQSGATIPLLAQPDPLAISSAATRHSADSDGDGKIGLFELTRVIELYNVRLGTTRTGAYKVDGASEDGFVIDPMRSGTAALTPFHTADTNRDAQFSLIELTRVIELFNTRSGTTRTGAYHVQAGTEDGFAPGL